MILNKVVVVLILGTLCLGGSVLAQDGNMEDVGVDATDHQETCKDVCYELWCECAIECFLGSDMGDDMFDESCIDNCGESYPELMEKCDGDLCSHLEIVDPFEYFGYCDGNYTMAPSQSAVPSSSPSSHAPSSSPSSHAPSLSPSYTQTPTSSATPTVDCTCCNCTHTSGCHNDPHYRTWNNNWFDFQGACDQIAIDNHILQLQIRTRPRQWYSTVTEVGLLMKLTGETFHAIINPTNDIVVDNHITAASDASYSNLSGDHKINFIDGEDSYILIRKSGTGMSVSVKGQGYIFTDSEGMFGSWNYGGVRYPNGTVFDLSGGYWDVRDRSIELAESWMVLPSDSLMISPSTICDPRAECGQDELFDCDGVENGIRRLQINPGCERTCEDIPNALLREACKKDLELTDDPTWACEADYVDPIIVESNECEFEKDDDRKCQKVGENCQRLGGFCKLDCESTDDHVCLPGLCSTRWPFQKFPAKPRKDLKPKHKKNPRKSLMAFKKALKKKKKKCECFVPVKCAALP